MRVVGLLFRDVFPSLEDLPKLGNGLDGLRLLQGRDLSQLAVLWLLHERRDAVLEIGEFRVKLHVHLIRGLESILMVLELIQL